MKRKHDTPLNMRVPSDWLADLDAWILQNMDGVPRTKIIMRAVSEFTQCAPNPSQAQKIEAGLKEAIAISRGEAKPAKATRVRVPAKPAPRAPEVAAPAKRASLKAAMRNLGGDGE